MTVLDVLFVSGDIGGNVPPTVAIAEELARRGHRVTVAGIRLREGDDWPDGIAPAPLPSLAGMDVTRDPGPRGHAANLWRMAMGAGVTRDVRNLLDGQRWDAVVVDGVMLKPLREVLRSGVPTAVLFHSFGKFWSDGMGGLPANALLRPVGLSPLALLNRADALLLPTDRELDPAGDGSSRIGFDWLGTTEHGRPPEPRVPGEPRLVLVSLSTAWQRRQGDVYRRIIEAIGALAGGETPVRAIVTTGGASLDGELRPAPHVEVRGRSPHAEILPHADLVIGHGGHSTALRTLAHGVPILVLPLDRFSDQTMIGKIVESAGVGATLSREVSPDVLRDAVVRLLTERDIRDTAARTGERLRAQRGAEAGADRIEAIARRP